MAKSHPKGLYVLFVTEMWERFSYYGMRGIFSLYMIKALLFDKALSGSIYGSYTGLVYLTPLIGGYVADRYWGNRRSIFFGGILMAIGQFLLFISASMYESIALGQGGLGLWSFYGGLGFLIFGNGFFKPNISTMVGQLYPKNDTRLDSAMTIFYMGINLGAFIAPLVAGGLGDTGDPSDFKWGFLAAAIGMVISTILFETLKNKYLVTPDGDAVGMPPTRVVSADAVRAKDTGKSTLGIIGLYLGLFSLFFYLIDFDLIGSFIFTTTIVAMVTVIGDSALTKIEKERIGVVYVCAIFVIFFWSAFEQAGVSLTFFAEEQTNRDMLGFTIPASWFQSVNALFIVVFAPIVAWLWTKLETMNREPSSIYKQSIGLFLLALGYLFIAFGVDGLDPNVKVSMLWLVGLYWLHTMGELALSPIGLSMVVKLSPVKFTSLLMGVWFLAMATANKFAGELSRLYPEEQRVESVYSLSEEEYAQYSERLDALSWNVGYFTEDRELKDQVITFQSADDEVIETRERTFVDALLKREDKQPKKKLSSLSFSTGASYGDNVYKLRRVLPREPSESELKKLGDDHTLPEYTYGLNQAGTMFYYLLRDNGSVRMEVWNFAPEKPSFFGFKISTLYDFFMIFVFLAGGASLVLFLLGKKLIRMMNGIR